MAEFPGWPNAMIGKLKVLFSNVSTIMGYENKDSLMPPGSTPPRAWVYIWKMTPADVGHAAIKLEEKPPRNPAELYISIHPKHFPAAGPLVAIPLEAELAASLDEDMQAEAASRSKAPALNPEDMENLSESKTRACSMPPDQVIEISHLDADAMQIRANEVRKKIATGEIKYQLLPKIGLFQFAQRFFKDAPALISQDPIDTLIHMRTPAQEEAPSPQVHNCTTLVSDILKAGGMDIPDSRWAPWGITPDRLGKEIHAKKRTIGKSL